MVFVLSGPVHGGKTTFLEESLPRWAARGLAFGGFLSIAATDGKGQKGYDLLEIRTGRRIVVEKRHELVLRLFCAEIARKRKPVAFFDIRRKSHR